MGLLCSAGEIMENMKKLGAKAKLGIMQGRGLDSCTECGEDCSPHECLSCGERLCKDCGIDHEERCGKDSRPGREAKKK